MLKNNIMSRVLVIGNGFDLNQGYKTLYSDFLSFTENIEFEDIGE